MLNIARLRFRLVIPDPGPGPGFGRPGRRPRPQPPAVSPATSTPTRRKTMVRRPGASVRVTDCCPYSTVGADRPALLTGGNRAPPRRVRSVSGTSLRGGNEAVRPSRLIVTAGPPPIFPYRNGDYLAS